LGADGISINGLFANSEPEASMTMALLPVQKELICFAMHRKSG
jgi:hypothetical protein